MIGGHACALELVVSRTSVTTTEGLSARREESPVPVRLINEDVDWDTVPLTDVQLARVPIEAETLHAIRFEFPEEDLSEIIGSASAPRLSASQPMDTCLFARRAGLRGREARVVILIIEVRPDGSVGSIDLWRSDGSSIIDKAAIEFARSLHWIPGTRDHRPQAMRVDLPVTLACAT